MESDSGKGFHRVVAIRKWLDLRWNLNRFIEKFSGSNIYKIRRSDMPQEVPPVPCSFWIPFVFRIHFFPFRFISFAPMLKRKKKSSIRMQKQRFPNKHSFWFRTLCVSSKSFFGKTFSEDVPLLALTSVLAFPDNSSSSCLLISCVELCLQQCSYRRKLKMGLWIRLKSLQ